MAEQIDVYLITGFLGSGKTTFLNHIVKQFPRDQKLMILMNEFGEIGIDGALVAGEDLDIWEISKGSIFCACVKTDFIKGLYAIAQKVKPEVLLIESTGVANPADLKKDLRLPIFNDCFRFQEQFCIIDAAYFGAAYRAYASVERQIVSSTRFIINKTDLASREQIEAIKALVKAHHPDPPFYETTYGQIDVADLLALPQPPAGSKAEAIRQLTEAELDQYVEDLLSDPQASLTPPDILMSASFAGAGGNETAIEAFTRKLPAEVVRAKGFLTVNGRPCLYSYVLGQFNLAAQNMPVRPEQHNVLIFIAPPRVMPAVEEIMTKYGFQKTGEIRREFPV